MGGETPQNEKGSWGVWLAQLLEQVTPAPVVMSSSLMLGVDLT